jgi:hypothetical protein
MEVLYNSTFCCHDGVLLYEYRSVSDVLLYEYRPVSDSAHCLLHRQHLILPSLASGVRYSCSFY